jgi:mRNA interferase RelE/StbE
MENPIKDYEVRLHPRISKQLKNMSSNIRNAVLTKMRNLARDPRPMGHEKIKKTKGYRLRHGDLRIIYEIDDRSKIVSVQAVLPRNKSYR